jgi:DNA polymerase
MGRVILPDSWDGSLSLAASGAAATLSSSSAGWQDLAQHRSDLAAQRRLLQSLGFGFLETAYDQEQAPAKGEKRPVAKEAPAPKAPSRSRTAAPPRTETAPSAPISATSAVPQAPAERQGLLDELHQTMLTCERCNLHHIRQRVVPGQGLAGARLFVVAEAPLAHEDASGLSLEGPVGEMARKLFGAMKLAPEEIYYTTAVKCRPPDDRAATAIERRACQPFLTRQLQLVQPEIIVTFGIEALAAVLPAKSADGIQVVRGQWLDWQRIPVMATLSLPQIHGDPALKRIVWGDMQAVMKRMGLG